MTIALTPVERWDFEGHTLDVYHDKGDRWVRVGQIDLPLGYTSGAGGQGVWRLIQRNPEDFGPGRQHKLRVQTSGGPQWQIALNPKGIIRACMLADTAPARKMRDWMERVLQGLEPPPLGFAPAQGGTHDENPLPVRPVDGHPALEALAHQVAQAAFRGVMAAGPEVLPYVAEVRRLYGEKARIEAELSAVFKRARKRGVESHRIKMALEPPTMAIGMMGGDDE